MISCFTNPLTAQDEKHWSIERCIQYAMDNNLEVKMSRLSVNQSQEAIKYSRHQRLPSVGASASYNWGWGRNIDPFTNVPVTEGTRTSSFGISANMVLFNGNKINSSVKQSHIDLQASQYDVQKSENDLKLFLVSDYLQILIDRENLENAKRTVETTQSQLERTEKLVQAGALPEADLYDLRSQLATNELQMVNAENKLSLSYLNLKQRLQLTEQQEFEVIIPEIPEPDASLMVQNIEEVYHTALSLQPEIKSADLKVQSAELSVQISKADYYPTLSLQGGLSSSYSSALKQVPDGFETLPEPMSMPVGFVDPSYTGGAVWPVIREVNEVSVYRDADFFTQLDKAFRQYVGLNLSIPIYQKNQVNYSVARSKVQYETAKLNSQIERNTLRKNIEQAYYNARAAAKTYASNKRQLEALQEQFRVTEQRYKSGMDNVTDYIISQNQLNNAQSDLIWSKYDFMFKLKVMDFYLGKEITF
ncbi:TolC family protein [Rapidithrix thailandica]